MTETVVKGNNIYLESKSIFDAESHPDSELHAVELPTIVETYQNGASWYRLYSDGWIEQGGTLTFFSDSWTLIFPVPFVDENYSLMGEVWGSGATSNLGITTQTDASASGNLGGSSGATVTWIARGKTV